MGSEREREMTCFYSPGKMSMERAKQQENVTSPTTLRLFLFSQLHRCVGWRWCCVVVLVLYFGIESSRLNTKYTEARQNTNHAPVLWQPAATLLFRLFFFFVFLCFPIFFQLHGGNILRFKKIGRAGCSWWKYFRKCLQAYLIPN